MADLVVRGATVLAPEGWVDGDLCIAGGAVVSAPVGGAAVLDAAGLLAVPGFVDVQCNGGLGIDLASEPERMWELAASLPRWGVTAWLPTIVTGPPAVVHRALDVLVGGPPPGWIGAVPLGLHLEGPFLAPERRGAHDVDLLQRPTIDAVAGWSRRAGVAMVTLAPELPGALGVIAVLTDRGVVVSLGHSAATAAEATTAVEMGATAVTHLFNAMPPLHHRAPGLAGMALVDERVHAGVIVDGHHLAPEMVRLVQRVLGERLVLVSDAVGALGLAPGSQSLGRVRVTVGEDGAVRLADGTLAGTARPLDAAVRALVHITGCPPGSALRAASAAPARLLGDAERGSLEIGARGDVALVTPDLEVTATVVGGVIVHRAGLDRSGSPS